MIFAFFILYAQIFWDFALPLASQSLLYGVAVSLSLWAYRNSRWVFLFDLALSTALFPMLRLTPLLAGLIFAVALNELVEHLRERDRKIIKDGGLKSLIGLVVLFATVDAIVVWGIYRHYIPDITIFNLVPYAISFKDGSGAAFVSPLPLIGSGDFAIPAFLTLISNTPLVILPLTLAISTLILQFCEPEIFPMLIIILPVFVLLRLCFTLLSQLLKHPPR